MTQVSFSETKYWLRTARTISEALPYLRRYAGRRFVVKYGGHAMVDAELARVFAQDIVLLKQVGIHPIVVHGGGPQIGQMLDRLAIKSEFVDGLRVTDQATVDVVEMVLSGSINKQIVSAIQAAGGSAIGLSGKDAGLMTAERLYLEKDGKKLDIGLVGDPKTVNPAVLDVLQTSSLIPVIAPVGVGADGATYNINADTAAGAIASASKAMRLFLLTDVTGVLDKTGKLIEELTTDQVAALKKDGTISGGMIPKLETCLRAVEEGVEAAVIMDGRIPHAMLLEVFTPHGIGTLVRKA